ncbi:MAG: hypothetical protein ACRDG9_07280 [Actinomycetota bacterium]
MTWASGRRCSLGQRWFRGVRILPARPTLAKPADYVNLDQPKKRPFVSLTTTANKLGATL